MANAMPRTVSELAALIDHTLLAPQAGRADIDRLCEQADEWRVCSVCVHPCWVPRAAELLAESPVRVCTVVGFPLGASASAVKVFEASQARDAGADELDMVINGGWLRDGAHQAVREEIAAVVDVAAGRVVKVILETAGLDEAQLELGCELALAAGAHFVKTSTGFGPGGATVAAVEGMRRAVGTKLGVKASGGIRDAASARAMLTAGATRLGASASRAILDGWQ